MDDVPPPPGNPIPLLSVDADALLDLGFLPDRVNKACPDQPGDVMGRYRLTAPLGEGGFGVVWEARQTEPIQRDIALKLIKRGMDSCEIIARFQAESQALARMDHPNIAAVLDAGTTVDGRPYFAMELVKGSAITTYCDDRGLSLRDRLELFIPVCQGIQHAHQKSILHRDLKPSNILVTEVDGKAVPKVIDFGIAKALGAPNEACLQDSLLRTRVGSVVGTLQYMSPEQAGSVPDVDTRSDIYSLGVLLYELLTGRTPLDASASQEEMLRSIREVEPARPSTRIADAGARGMDASRLRRQLRGDLDWIVLKALEKDRRRRYETANGLAADLKRYLSEEAVTAAAPTWSYQTAKFARRHRVGLAVAGTISATMVAGIAVSLWQAAEAKKATTYAEQRRIEAEANARRAREAVEMYLSQVTDDTKLREEGFQSLRKKLLESALPFYVALGQTESHEPAFRAERAGTLGRLGVLYREIDQRDKGLAVLREAAGIEAQLVAEFPENPQYRRALEIRYNNLCVVLREAGHKEEAIGMQERAVAIVESLIRDFPADEMHRGDLSVLLVNLGQAQAQAGHLDQGVASLLRAIKIREDLAAESKDSTSRLADVAWGHADLARMLYVAGKPAEAEPRFRQALDIQEKLAAASGGSVETRQNVANSCHNFGTYLGYNGKPEDALAMHRRAEELNRQLIVEFPKDINRRHALAMGQHAAGEVLITLHRPEEAAAALQESLSGHLALAVSNPENPGHAHLAGLLAERLGWLRRESGDPTEALKQYRKSAELLRQALAGRTDNADYLKALGKALQAACEVCLESRDAAGLLDFAGQLAEAFPNKWEQLDSAAGFAARAIPLLAADPNLSPDKKSEAMESTARQAVEWLRRAAELADNIPLAEDARFASLRERPDFLALLPAGLNVPGTAPSRFTFDYQHSDPGKRVWTRIGNVWTEVQPSGKTNQFLTTRRLRVSGVTGTEIRRTSSAMWLFVPDKNSTGPLHLKMRNEGTDWGILGEIGDVE